MNISDPSAVRIGFRATAVLMCSIICLLARASAEVPQRPPDFLSPQEFGLEEFEPAVREQISQAYELVQRHPGDAALLGKLGMLFQVYARYDLAERCYMRAHDLDPRSFRWTYYLAAVDGLLGKNVQAIALLRAALALDPTYAPGRVRLAQVLFDAGETEESERVYRAVIAQAPRLASAHFGLGKILAARGDRASAIESLRRACELADNYAAAHYALAMAYRDIGDSARSRIHLERSQRLKETKQPSQDPLMDEVNALYSGGLTHFATGSSLAREGKLTDAAAQFESALVVNPRLVMAHINLIAMYGQLGFPDKAERHFRAAVALDPGWVEAYHNWGMLLIGQGKKAQATQAFSRAIEVNPNHADSHFQLGTLLEESGQSGPAATHFERALEINPEHRQAHYFLARNLVRAGRADDAIRHLLKTIKVEDDWTPFCMRALAIAYETAGKRDKALDYIQEARQRALARHLSELASQLQQDAERLKAGGARN
jgi:tetratricopeptide (TPR) repeat protein